MIKIEVDKGVSSYEIKGSGKDIAAEIALAVCTLEEYLVKECGVDHTLASALIIDAYKSVSSFLDGKYESSEEKTNE